jgi:hypothetical protein
MVSAINRALVRTLTDAKTFGGMVGGASWLLWRACLSALFGVVPDDASQRAAILKHTGRSTCPTRPAESGWLVVGRRGGKSRVAAIVAVLLACFRRYDFAPGERGVLMVIASDRKQARVVFRYIRALLARVPMLEAMVASETKEALQLANGVDIEVHTCSFRAVRGYSVIGAILDEVAFYPVEAESAAPDSELVAALRPAMASVPGALLLGISSPYAKRGELWRNYERHFGRDDSGVLVWQASTDAMNPTIDPAIIARAYEEDETAASAEYGARFRSDLESFVSRDVLRAAVVPDRHELPPRTSVRYVAFTDPSGGSADSMTLAIAHLEGERIVLDAVRERRAPFNPESVVEEFAGVLSAYGLVRVTGDRYAGEWPSARFRVHNITYLPSPMPKSDLYAALLPKLNAGQIELLDVPRLVQQIGSLERRTARSGKDSIDHPPRQHDDLANSVAGVVGGVLKSSQTGTFVAVVRANDRRAQPSHALASIHRRKARQSAIEQAELIQKRHPQKGGQTPC